MDDTRRLFVALLAAFPVQVGGRLLDLRWHQTHSDFETGRDQLQAHWLVWLGTLMVIGVALMAMRLKPTGLVHRAYQITLWANALYVVVAVIHFFQHLDHQEVDWAHAGLAVTNIAAATGIVMVTASMFGPGRKAEVSG
jgi:hypothetical protein